MRILVIFVFVIKKGVALISFVIYLAATSGIIINAHYCMKSLVSVKLFNGDA
ncbi:MAG: hypothetical protein IPG86_13975 [Chitinophagaceae bacterium]|nr:hypothetical protein [Chitinophagaceae bacterium]